MKFRFVAVPASSDAILIYDSYSILRILINLCEKC